MSVSVTIGGTTPVTPAPTNPASPVPSPAQPTTGTATPPPHGHPGLPFTGLPSILLLALGAALVAVGVVVTRLAPSDTRRSRMRTRPALALGVLLLTAAAALPALADSTTVSVATTGPGTRQLDLLDLTGADLTDLPLTPGVPQGFRVRVSDDSVDDLTTGFTVSAVMSNLYRSTGASSYAWADKIASSDVRLDYATSPFSALGLSYEALPKVSITGTVPNCTTLVGLGLSLTVLTNAGVCTVVGLTGYAVPGPVTVPSSITALVDTVTAAPYDLSGNTAGAFGAPDWSTGIGNQAAQPGNDSGGVPGQAGDPLSVMVGTFTGVSNLLADIDATLGGITPGLVKVSQTGSGAYAKVSDVLSGLSAQGASTLANAIAALPLVGDQVTVLSQLTYSLVTPTVTELTNEIGTYNAFPLVTVDPSTAVSTGTYQGTLTVTMVQP